jgi:succinate dehydrogenase / fumarate reductase cytochrome b subunit
MHWVSDFVGSTIGKKILMAVSGVGLVGFLVAHLTGNLLVYKGPEAMNAYGAQLHALPALLWTLRLGMITLVGIHVWASTQLTLANRAARPVGYRAVESDASTYASRTMWWSGPLLLGFLIYHLLHFTTGHVHPDFVPGDVYSNFVLGFQVPWTSTFYIVSMLALGLHLRHGVSSMLQTVGLSHPRYNHLRLAAATLVSSVIVAGNITFPVAVLTGFVK